MSYIDSTQTYKKKKNITCIFCTINVDTDPDCYQLISVSGIFYSTTTMKYDVTSTTTDESLSR